MLLLSINIMSSEAFSVPSMLDDDDVWMPNLRGLPIGREGEIVAEFEVASSPIRNGADDDYEDIYQRIGNKEDDHKPCVDPDSRAILYPLDNFKWNESNFQRPLALKSTTRRLNSGRFGPTTSYQSLEIEGRCCWEAFTREAFQGRMLRLCRGKYSANILGRMANNIRSIRPVEHF